MDVHVAIATALVFLVITIQFGRATSLPILAIAVILFLLYTERQEKSKGLAEKDRKYSIVDLIPEPGVIGPEDPVSQEQFNSLVIPQDAAYQVPIVDIEYQNIPKHPVIRNAVSKLSEVRRRRPAAMKICLANIERFLGLHASLKAKKVPAVGNSKHHELAKQRLANMAMLRIHALEQLQSIAFEFTTKNKVISAAVASIRDYTHALYTESTRRWRSAVPSLGNGMPPYGVIANSMDTMNQTVYL